MPTETLDLAGLAATIVIATSVAGIGYALDRLLLDHQRIVISEKTLKLWSYIEQLKIRDLVRITAISVLRKARFVLGKKIISLRFFLSALLISVTLATMAILIGDYIFYGNFNDTLANLDDHKVHIILPLNAVADCISLFITMNILWYAARRKNTILKAVIVSFDICLAVTISFALFFVAQTLEFSMPWSDFSRIPVAIEKYLLFIEYGGIVSPGTFDWISYYSEPEGLRHYGPFASFLYTFSVLLPTLLVFLSLLVISIAYLSTTVAQFTTLQLLQLDIETDKSIFFYVGVFISIIGLIAKISMEVGKLV